MGQRGTGRTHNGSYTSYGAGARRLDGVADYQAATAAVVAKANKKDPAKLVREVLGDAPEKPGVKVLVEGLPPKRG